MFRTTRAKVDRFRRGRERQSDADFLVECELPEDPDASRVALAVRHAVGAIGLVDSQYVRADDRYPDELAVLPLWDSMDWVGFIMEIEEELGIDLCDADAQAITSPRGFSVRRCVHAVLAVVERTRAG